MSPGRFLAVCCLVCALAVSPRLSHAQFDSTQIDSCLNASAVPDHITLTWTDDPSTTQTVTWRARWGSGDGAITYRRSDAPADAAVTIAVSPREFSTVSSDLPGRCLLYTTTLRGLDPGVRYLYRVSAGVKSSPEYEFSTMPKDPSRVTFLVFGDSQPGVEDPPSYAPWHQTLTAAVARHSEAMFALSTGDLTDEGMTYLHWHNWFAAAGDVLARLPFLPVTGNHDCVGAAPDPGNPRRRPSFWRPPYLLEQFPLFRNGPAGLEGQAWSFDCGEVHLSVVNSERAFGERELVHRQVAWLNADLCSSDKRWKLVFFHRPPYYSRASRTNEEVRKLFCPILENNRVDVVFSGHDHAFARTWPMRAGKMYSSPTEGTVYYITGRSGGYPYRDVSRKIWHAFFYDVQDQPCYLAVDVEKDLLSIRTYKTDGTLIDRYVIDKGSGSQTTLSVPPARCAVPKFVLNGDLPPQHASENGALARLVDGRWFVNARVFLGCLGGTAVEVSGTIHLILERAQMTVPEAETFFFRREDIAPLAGSASGRTTIFVSTDVIQQFTGYSHTYDEDLNLLFFSQ